jgi:hypothetical protein
MKTTRTNHRSRNRRTTTRRRISRTHPNGTVDRLTDKMVDLAQGAAAQVGSLVKTTASMITEAGSKVRRRITRSKK